MKISYYGKYRALVYDNNDPDKRGRIRVRCPKVLGKSISKWCEPCLPCAIDNDGDICVPSVNDSVWIEFEEGDVNKPIYTGSWWSTNNTPLGSSYDKTVRHISWGDCKIDLFKKIVTNGVVTREAEIRLTVDGKIYSFKKSESE